MIMGKRRRSGTAAAHTAAAVTVAGRLPADRDDQVLRAGHRDVGGLARVVVVGEAVLQAVDRVGVPELGVVVGRGGLVEVGRVRLLGGGQLRDVPVQAGA